MEQFPCVFDLNYLDLNNIKKISAEFHFSLSSGKINGSTRYKFGFTNIDVKTGVITNNTNPTKAPTITPTVTPEKNKEVESIKLPSIEELNEKTLERYLNAKYSTINTDFGSFTNVFDVIHNTTIINPFDYKINISSMAIYNFILEYKLSNQYTKAQKEAVIKQIKDFEEAIARELCNAYPTIKMEGSYNISGYDYPTIKKGYYSYDYFSWNNYDTPAGTLEIMYNKVGVSQFKFDEWLDDKLISDFDF